MEKGQARLENLCKQGKENEVTMMMSSPQWSWISGRRVVEGIEIGTRKRSSRFERKGNNFLMDKLILRICQYKKMKMSQQIPKQE